MKIHSLKLTIQDLPDKNGELFAGVYGTLTIDTGEVKRDENGEPVADKEGMLIPILDDINFVQALNKSKELKAVVQAIAVEALTLKDMTIAKKNGQLSHYIKSVKGLSPVPKKRGSNVTKPKKRK